MALKSHSGAKKRLKITGRKKFVFRKSSKSHLLLNKSRRQKASFVKGKLAEKTDIGALKKMLPFSM